MKMIGVLIATIVAALVLGASSRATTYFSYSFDRPDGLITNEYAFWNSPSGVQSSDWDMTSGSLFASFNTAWTGKIDSCAPDYYSSKCTNSAVFRLTTKRTDFGNVRVDFDLRNDFLTQTSSTPAVAWDGVHIFLRYKSEYQLYYASVNRRDGHIVLKKKCPGGSSNGGTYYTLAESSGYGFSFGSWQKVGAFVFDGADGSVRLGLYRDGALRLAATDRGIGCAPLRGTGAVGVRGDNDGFHFDNFTVVSALDALAARRGSASDRGPRPRR
jgi:hypothetical protein